jgi:LAS seventeen-binding protein 1/2
VLAHAKALYKYTASDAQDVSFEKEDRIAIHEYMNNDWWMGKNLRTGQEGIFPKSYVLVEQEEKAGFNAYAAPQDSRMYPGNAYQPSGPPAPQNPYNANIPPMAIADGSGQPSKGAEMGKKFGKKLVS